MGVINPPLPEIGADLDAWGTKLNDALTQIVTQGNANDARIAGLSGGSAPQTAIDLRTISGFDQTAATSIHTALNTALTNASATGALRTVYVPPSTTGTDYPMSGSVTLKSGVTLEFAPGAKVKLSSGFTGAAFTASTLTGARIKGLTLDGNKSAASSAGHLISVTTSGSDLILSGLTLSNAAGNGITLTSVADAQIIDTTIDGTSFGISATGSLRPVLKNVKVKNSTSYLNNQTAGIYLLDCDYGTFRDVESSFNHGHGAYFGLCDYFTVVDSSFHDNGYLTDTGQTDEGWRRGLTLSSSNPNTHFTLENVRLYNNIENGILASAGNTYLTAVNCRSYNNNLQNAPGGHGFELNGQFTTVRGCYAWGNNGGFSHNGSNLTISDSFAWANTNGTTPTGFKFYNGSSQKVIGCQAWGQSIGFDFNGDTGIVMAGAILIGNEAYSNTTYGIQLSDNVQDPILDDNYAHGNTTKDLHDQSVYTGSAAPTTSVAINATQMNLFGSAHETIPRWGITSASVTLGSGTVRFAFFTARTAQSGVGIRIISGGTAAGATPSLVRFGLYSVSSTGTMTLIASTASDTTVFSASGTSYSRLFTAAPSALTVTGRYAIGILVISTATMPTIAGSTPSGSAFDMAQDPQVVGTLASQTDLPASTTTGALAQSGGLAYAVLY